MDNSTYSPSERNLRSRLKGLRKRLNRKGNIIEIEQKVRRWLDLNSLIYPTAEKLAPYFPGIDIEQLLDFAKTTRMIDAILAPSDAQIAMDTRPRCKTCNAVLNTISATKPKDGEPFYFKEWEQCGNSKCPTRKTSGPEKVYIEYKAPAVQERKVTRRKRKEHFQPFTVVQLRDMSYDLYMKTEHWQRIRDRSLEEANYACRLCNTKTDLHVHHRTYVNRGQERPWDVVTLCGSCHREFHKWHGRGMDR